jgi:hypothetical protein
MSLVLIHRIFTYGLTVALLIAFLYSDPPKDALIWEVFKVILTVTVSIELLRIGPNTPEPPKEIK